MNWGEIKLATLKKIDPAIKNLAENRNTRDYLNTMVETANRGLQDLVTVGKFITKNYKITQFPMENELSDTMKIFQSRGEVLSFAADGARSYYFEVDGPATAEIYTENILRETITNKERGFHGYKGLIENEEKRRVRIDFKSPYPFQVRNVALYRVTFEQAQEVWEYASEKRYNLKVLLPDFYKLVTSDVVYQSNETRYTKDSSYYWEGDSTLVLDGFKSGEWIVHYYSYPQLITKDTPDDTQIELDPEVAVLLPVYMASQLYEEDDVGVANYWEQQYQESRSKLIPNINLGRASEFLDEYGWS